MSEKQQVGGPVEGVPPEEIRWWAKRSYLVPPRAIRAQRVAAPVPGATELAVRQGLVSVSGALVHERGAWSIRR